MTSRVLGATKPAAHDQFSTARLVVLQVRRNLTLHHLALAPTDRCHIDRDGTRHRAELRSMARQMRDPRAENLILAGHAGDVDTGAPNPPPLHDGSPPP